MTARFRIRTSAGQEVSFATKEMFEDFVRSGDLSPDDLVYDGETGSWSSARTHPAVLAVQYEMEPEAGGEDDVPAADGERATDPADAEKAADAERAADAEKAADAERAAEKATGREKTGDVGGVPVQDGADADTSAEGASAPGSEVELDFDLELTEEMSPEESKRIFLEQLEAERQADIEANEPGRDNLSGFTIDSESMGQGLQEQPSAAGRPRPPTGSGSGRRDSPTRRAEPGRREASRRRPQPAGRPERPGTKVSKRGGLGRVLRLLVLLAVLGAGGYVAYELFLSGSESGDDDTSPGTAEAAEVDAAPISGGPPAGEGAPGAAEIDPGPEGQPVAGEAGPRPADIEDIEPTEPVIAATESAIRGRAHERYLAATQRMLRELEPIPDVWPTGPYLSVPSDYPEVVDAWQDYLSTIEAVRPGDEERYHVAYRAALDDAAVTGEARRERLDRGLADFAETDALRQAHFDRVEALARAALQSHNALTEVEGTILYDATGSTGRQEGVGRGTSARDAESRLVLDQVIELLEAALDADGQGPGSGENVREWVWDGFLEAATR